MSQKVTRKKRLKTSHSASNLPKKEDSDLNNFFKDCLTFIADVEENNENKLSKISGVPGSKNVDKEKSGTNSRAMGLKSKTDKFGSLIPPKKYKTALTENASNMKSNNDKSKNQEATSPYLSVSKNQKSFTLGKNRSNVFDNITESFSSSKILSVQALSDITSQKRLELSSWGLPPLILEKYEARGIKTMFPWQVECLANRKILEENKNLVYSAPTSAGKTLVAEFLVLKTVLERRKKVIFILPFVSVVREKMFYFQDLLSDSGIRVEGFMGGVAPAGGFAAVHIAIATIEKANSLINRLMEDGDLVTLGAVVIDELHLLGDPGRGYLLELLLTKLRYMTLNLEHVEIQLIGMSATLPNLPLIAEWLDAELYKTDFRPIPLNEQCKIGNSLLDSKLNVVREIKSAPDIVEDPDNIIQLCIETINGGHGVLIFCPTKNWCEKLALQMASTFFQLGRDNTPNGQILRKNIDATGVQEVLVQLEHCPVGLDNVLKKTVSYGVAFHHAGLTMDERDIIEGGFRVGSLKVLIATSTLSSGVNLPARRVIIRSPMFNGKPLDKLTYQQMIGRAGRMGKDTEGESILICKQNERIAATNLITSTLEPIVSCLEGSGPLIRALLEAIASQIVKNSKDLDFYSKCTFIYKCQDSEVKDMVEEAVKFLISNEFLLVKNGDADEQRMVATCLGKACLSASIPPREGLFLFEELQRARKCFVLDTELHVVYLVTPFNSGSQINLIDWMVFLEMWRKLTESERRVGQLVGVEEKFLMTAMRGIVKPGKTLNIHRRFYTAMALHDLVREVPLNTVCRKYNCCRGLLQSLQQSSSTFAGMVTNFCKELKWDCMELLFAQFQARLQFGVCRDLLDLLRLPSLNGLRARSLYKYGITTVAELAVASDFEVEEALNKALPFESEKNFDGDNEVEIAKRNKMRTVFITGKDGLTAREAALIVINEARVLVKNELGVRDVQWSQSNKIISQASSRTSVSHQISLKPLSLVDEVLQSRTVSVVIHAVDDKAGRRLVDEIPIEIKEERNAKIVTVNENHPSEINKILLVSSENVVKESNKLQEVSTITRSNLAEKKNIVAINEKIAEVEKRLSVPSESLSMSSGDVINVSDKPETNSRTLRSRLSEKMNIGTIIEKDGQNVKRLSITGESLSLSSEDVINESDKESQTSARTLRSRLAEKTRSLRKDDQISIRSINFDDKMSLREKQSLKTKVSSPKDEKCKANSLVVESFQLSERALNEMMQIVEEQDKNTFAIPATVGEVKPNEEKRISGGSNYSKSPSLFSDSSFLLDAQVCSILEKNVIMDSHCLADFEKSDFTQQNQDAGKVESTAKTAQNNPLVDNSNKTEKTETETISMAPPKNESNARKDKIKENPSAKNSQKIVPKDSMAPLTWTEDSWDQTKNLPLDKPKNENTANEKAESDSPSMLQMTRVRTRIKRTNNQTSLSKIKAATSKEKSLDSPLFDTPRSILRKQSFDKDDDNRSPVAGIRTYNTRGPFILTTTSLNKSDSEDSIISSQTADARQATVNKTRRRLEQRLIHTQKLVRSSRTKNSSSKVVCSAAPKLLKLNTEPIFKDSSSSNEDSSESCLMFDSDDTVKSQTKKSNKNKKDAPSDSAINLLKVDPIPILKNDGEKISPKTIEPINVANSKRTFREFRSEIEGLGQTERRYDLAVAIVTEHYSRDPAVTIGNRIIGIDEKKKKDKKNDAYIYGDKKICGIVFCWGVGSLYYMPFGNTQETKLTIKERSSFLRDILTNSAVNLRCFNAKEVYKMLYVRCEIEPCCKFLDPKAGDWLMNSETCNKSYSELAAQHFPRGLDIANAIENNYRTSALASNSRAAAKALLAWYTIETILDAIGKQSPVLLSAYREVEMPTIIILARMELRGVAINTHALQELSTVLKNDLAGTEEKAFKLAGRKFNFYSSKEVAQVLGLNKKGRGGTNKNALRSCENPISNLITLWRKLSTVQTKIVFPLLQLEKKNNRLHGNCITYTVTGRVSMHDPNLQTIPRDFKSEKSGCILSVRMAFVPADGNVMLSADFCQLELRILAHFSQDPTLCKLMHEQGDIFKNIAARLNNITEDMVDDDMRQRAKQLCYAMIYGMGTKSLAETLSVTESEAKDYLEAFMGTYKGIRVWLNAVYDQAKVEGFVSTLTDRRRVLPGINSKIQAVKAQAERQAVNTKIQGSAADITKKAMVLIESKLREEFSYLPVTFPTIQFKRKLRSSDADSRPRGAYLILQLHDELLYEVNSNDLQQVATIVKESMEHAFELRVPLPVKVKVGTAWGNLEEYKI